MSRRKSKILAAIIGSILIANGSAVFSPSTLAKTMADVPATEPSGSVASPDVLEQLRQLQAKVDRLEAQQAKQQAQEQVKEQTQAQASTQAAEPPPIVLKTGTKDLGAPTNDVTSMVTGGWDGTRFNFVSTNGNFSLHPGALFELRNMTTFRERIPAKGAGEVGAAGYDTQNGFDISRARLIFDGTLFKQGGYFVQFQADQGNSFIVYDAYATYRFGQSPYSVKVGQFKDPVWHERNVSEANFLAVDRSLTENLLAGGQGSRVQGVALTYDADRIRAQIVAHDGFNTQNTKFFDSGGNGAGVGGESGVTPTNFGVSGRFEYMLIGERSPKFNPFNEYDQFSSLSAKQNILVVGGGADYSQASSNSLIAHTADIQYNNVNGFSAYAAYVGTYRGIRSNQGVPAGYYYDPGFVIQAGYLINQHIEPFIQYSYVHLDPASTAAVTGLNSHLVQQLIVGANYYIYGQKMKFTVDGGWLPNGSPVDADALGVLKDSGRYEFVLRTQLQLAI